MHTLFLLVTIIWGLTGVYWIIAAQNIKTSRKKEELGFRIFYMVLWVCPFMLVFSPHITKTGMFYKRIFPENTITDTLLFICVCLSLAFMIWSRIALGRNWSGRIAIKNDHELIVAGPYAYVRHPMYTGFISAFFFSAALQGEVRSLIATLILILGVLLKINLEEKFIKEKFGERYAQYSRKVKRLVPFVY